MSETDRTGVETETVDVCIVGAGPAGLTAGIFTARAGLDTLVLRADEPILRRNAHLENVPGFPAGVNSRLFLEMTGEQADRNGCDRRDGRVTRVSEGESGLLVETSDESAFWARYVLCTSWADTDYLEGLENVGLMKRGSKTYIDVDDDGWTGIDGLYAAGRIAGKPHQTVVAAGDGARVALTIIHDSDVPFYQDWVVPKNYFTGRGRDVPPGCEEIDEDERRQRERESMEVMQTYFSNPHPDEPTQHPSVREE